MIRSLLLSFLLMWALQAQALTLEGVDVPELLPATKDSPELHMRGASIRRVYGFVEVYVGALYIGDNTLADEQIIDADVARRMTFYVTSSRVSARRFTNAIQDGLSINVSKEKMEELSERLEQLVSLFDHKFVEGTVGYIEWHPESQSTIIAIDGNVRGSIPGKDLNDSLLKIWIGEKPVSERFKKEVLGHRS
ncbi:chalcone isomerase family protein [Thalassolituus marinus]|uniref:Chalcone isomerase family protein n=1 Tax=Thalassolituus marinus TaxID=671053 RepID=A0ABS7ZNR5_9GAMM|nr:chalcone isomerase family protein [Thalassolituus marinus]MCA6063343.1 chalcone isomerase family protein [Thalassolituus marinus]